jgi:hypothetical protein
VNGHERAYGMRQVLADDMADSAAQGDHYRALSARLSLATERVSTYGAERPTITERARRYDLDDRTSRDLEREADRLLRADGWTDMGSDGRPVDPVVMVDIVDIWTMRPMVNPDRVAFRGVARVKVKPCHRSDRHTTNRNRVFMVDSQGEAFSLTLARTSITHPDGRVIVDHGLPNMAPLSHAARMTVLQDRRIAGTLPTWLTYGHRTVGTKREAKPATTLTQSERTVRRLWSAATDEQRAAQVAMRSQLLADGHLTIGEVTFAVEWSDAVRRTTTRQTRVIGIAHDSDAIVHVDTIDGLTKRLALQ